MDYIFIKRLRLLPVGIWKKFEEIFLSFRRVRALQALNSIHREVIFSGKSTITGSEINNEIKTVRNKKKY